MPRYFSVAQKGKWAREGLAKGKRLTRKRLNGAAGNGAGCLNNWGTYGVAVWMEKSKRLCGS